MTERFEVDAVADPADRGTAAAIEAIVLVADEPVPPGVLAEVLEVSAAEVERVCGDLAREYREQGRGFELARVAGGYRFQTAPEHAPCVERFVIEGQTSRLSSAALETLAIVAYKQPISRAQLTSIRGVNVDGVVRSLQQRGYVTEVSRDPGPGQAVMFGTTPLFLERMGLDSVADLPPLGGFVPGADVVEALEQSLRLPTDDVVDSGDSSVAVPDDAVCSGDSVVAAPDA
jgi:segregation and condensation protein B